MRKTKIHQITVNEEILEKVICNMCGENFNVDEYLGKSFPGGSFTPSFCWCSKYDEIDSLIGIGPIDLCDKCWNKLFDQMVIDPRPRK